MPRWERLVRRAVLACLAACHDAPAVDASGDAATCEPERLAIVDEAGDDCSTFQRLPCGLPDGATVADCFPDLDTCVSACQTHEFLYCLLTPIACGADGGAIVDADTVVECVSCSGGGRRPRGYRAPRAAGRGELAERFARLAHLEAASVRAFEDLARSLDALGAPARLPRAARDAASDERRHARAVERLATRFGCRREQSPEKIRRVRPRVTLAALVRDDAIEGCVHETFGAFVTAWQGERAGDARVRATMRRIARDEARHAALAWEILRWGLPRLAPSERARVRARMRIALRALAHAPGGARGEARSRGGFPSEAESRRLAGAFRSLARAELRRISEAAA